MSELPIRSADGNIEVLSATESELFVVNRLVSGRTPDNSGFLKRTLGVLPQTTTARFYDTTQKILSAAVTGSQCPFCN